MFGFEKEEELDGFELTERDSSLTASRRRRFTLSSVAPRYSSAVLPMGCELN